LPVDPLPTALSVAYEALNLLGGDLDWAGLPTVMAILGIEDVEGVVRLMRVVMSEERVDLKNAK
jgi:hypothetical protein